MRSTEQAFWTWFRANDDALFHFDQDRERVFDALQAELAKVHQDLLFEFGPINHGKREFVISAGGLKSAFTAVEDLASAAPSFSRWQIIAFRPRRSSLMTITLGDRTVAPEDVECTLLSSDTDLGIYLFFKGYNESERKTFGQIAYLFLDEALGEYDVETKVGLIEFYSFNAHTDTKRVPITELAPWFDRAFASLKQ